MAHGFLRAPRGKELESDPLEGSNQGPSEESAEKVSDKAEKELESLIDDLEQLPLAGQIKFLEKIQHMLASKIIYINASNKELNVMLYQHRDIRNAFLHEIANNLE